MNPAVIAVRQNLTMLVDHGRPTAAAATADPIAVWGDPLHENVLTWRSALGVTAAGDLIYAAGPSILPLTLAQAMTVAGAVRAMELDINSEWVVTTASPVLGPTSSGRSSCRAWISRQPISSFPYTRDFFAVFVRSSAP